MFNWWSLGSVVSDSCERCPTQESLTDLEHYELCVCMIKKIITQFLSPSIVVSNTVSEFQKARVKGLRAETTEVWVWLTVHPYKHPRFDNSGGHQASTYGHQNWIHDSEGIKNRDKKRRGTWTRHRENHVQASRSHLLPKSKLRYELEMSYAREAH